MTGRKRSKGGEASRSLILETALRLFRERGFDETTMRDIAAEAGIAIGAAYYYFPAKETIVLAYYARVQDEHEEQAKKRLASISDLRERLSIVMMTKLDLLRGDRRLLRAILKNSFGADDTTGVFSAETKAIREQSIAIFREAATHASVPEESRALFGQALWALHLGLLLYFVNDESPGQTKTTELVSGSVDLVAKLGPLFASPMLESVRSQVSRLLENAGLLLHPDAPARHASEAPEASDAPDAPDA